MCVVVLMVISSGSNGQCPDRLRLQARINELKNAEVPFENQLNELLPASERLKNCPVKDDSVRVFLLQRIGALHYLSNNFGDAAAFTASSIDLLSSLTPSYSNVPLMIRMYHYLTIFYDSLHRVSDKMMAVDSCIRWALSYNAVDRSVIYNLWERVSFDFDVGDYERCLNDAATGEALTARYVDGSDSISFMTNFFSFRINALIELGRLEKAEEELNNKIANFTAKGLARLCGAFYNQLSHVRINQSAYKAALADLHKSLRCNELNNDPFGCKQTLSNIGYVYSYHLNDQKMALHFYGEAMRRQTVSELELEMDKSASANIMSNIAIAYAKQGRFDSSFHFFERAFTFAGTRDENSFLDLPQDQFTGSPKIQYIINLIRDKGDAYLYRYRALHDTASLKEAIRIYRVADQALARVKLGQREIQSKLQWRKNARTIYEHAIAASMEAGDPAAAFYFFEKSRAVLLNDQIIRNSRMDREEQLREAGINSRLATLKYQLGDSSLSTEKIAEIHQTIYTLSRERDQVAASKNIIDWKNVSDPEHFELQVIQKKLKDDGRSLLEIFSGDSAVYVFFATGDAVAMKKMNKEKYDDLSRRFMEYLSDYSKLNTHFAAFAETSQQLYHELFHDLRLPDQPLIISPDGYYFPFEPLVVKMNQSAPEYFIQSHAISYSYSARFLLYDFDRKPHEPAFRFLGVAPVVFPSYLGLPGLPGSDASLKQLAGFFDPAVTLIGKSATRRQFLDKYSGFSIVQLYTHAAEKSSAGDPVIYFADSALHLSDLLALQSPATRMIILNACETGRGKLYEGEGIFSFNRAFAEVGVPSATVNLWSVDDQSSYQLCELYYKYLAKGMPSDVALQQAKVEYITHAGKERSLPFYWAAPVLSGQVHSFAGTPVTPLDRVMLLTTIILLAGGIVVIARNFRPVSYRSSNIV